MQTIGTILQYIDNWGWRWGWDMGLGNGNGNRE